MSRKRSRKVLYEVSNEARKARNKRSRLGIVKRARAFTKNMTSGRAVDNIKKKSAVKPVGFKRNFIALTGRLMKFSVKKALILLVIFGLVVFLWPFGGKSEPAEPGSGPEIGKTGDFKGVEEIFEPEPEPTIDEGPGEIGPTEVAGPPKDHYIVIASHDDLDQLKALSGHFAENGIETDFKLSESGGYHKLITKDRYYKPGDHQSKIDEAKTKIKQVGNKYKPEYDSGYLRFKFDGIYADKEE